MTEKKRILYIVLAAALLIVIALIIFAVSRAGGTSAPAEATPEPTAAVSTDPSDQAQPDETAPIPTPAPTPTPEPTEELPVITPPASEPDPASGSDIVMTTVVPASDTDIPMADEAAP